MKRIDISTKTHPNTFTLVDNEDFRWLNQRKWRAAKHWKSLIVVRTELVDGHKATIRIHREILKTPPHLETDHKNHNTLDNQRSNLRVCTHAQNIHNQQARDGSLSKYKGVSKRDSRWFAQIGYKGMVRKLGFFNVEEDAARRYDEEAKILHGVFAALNFSE